MATMIPKSCVPTMSGIVLLMIAAMLVFALPANAAALADEQAIVESQNPGPVGALDIDAGYRLNYLSGQESESFTRITYHGQLVQSTGTPFKYARGLDLAAPEMPTGTGDRRRLELRFDKGTTRVGGSLIEAQGVAPLTLRGFEKLGLRGTGYIADAADGGLKYAAGLESAPIRIPGLSHSEMTNWIVLGLNAQRQEKVADEGGVSNSALGTYRVFVGKGYLWRKSADVGQTAQKIIELFLAQAPTHAQAQALADKIEKLVPPSPIQAVFYDAAREARNDEEWLRSVRDNALGYADAISDQSTVSVYVESSGWYTLSGDALGGRLKNLLTASVDYWFVPTRDDVFLRFRYENGYERAAPTERKNHLMVSLSLRY